MDKIYWNDPKARRSSLAIASVLVCILALGAVERSSAGDLDGVGGYRMPIKPDSHWSGGTGDDPNGQGSLEPSGGQQIGVDQDPTLGQPEYLAVRLTIRVSYLWFRMMVLLR